MNSEYCNEKSTNEPKTFGRHHRVVHTNTTDSADAKMRDFEPNGEHHVPTASHWPVRREDAVERTSSGGVYAPFRQEVIHQRPRNFSAHEIADATTVLSTGTSGIERNAAKRADVSVETCQRSIKKVTAILDYATRHTLSESSRALLDALVEAVDEKGANFRRVVDSLVQKAIEEPVKMVLYAALCSQAYGLALRQADDASFPGTFERQLTNACDRILMSAGVLDHTKPYEDVDPEVKRRRLRQDLEPREQIIRDRTTNTCMFLGHLFIAKGHFKLFETVQRNINTFLRARDEHSLECLCALLTTISSAFEWIVESNTNYKEFVVPIYRRLKALVIEGSRKMILPIRTIEIIHRLLKKWRKFDTSTFENHVPPFDNGQAHENHDMTDDSIRVETSVVSESVGQCTETPVNVVDSAILLPGTSYEVNVDNASVRIKASKIDNLVRERNGIKEEMLKASMPIGKRPKMSENTTVESPAVPKTSRPQDVSGTNDGQHTNTTQVDFEFGHIQRLFECVVFVIDSITLDTMSEGAKVFLDVLVAANNRDPSILDRITDYITQTAVERTKDSMMYAILCAEVINKATIDSRESVRNSFPRVFKYKLIRSCHKILSINPGFRRNKNYGDFEARRDTTTTNGDRSGGQRRPEEVFDADARVRTVGSCRFMGHLFVVNTFKMFCVIERTINALMTAGDDHSLECLCVLLTIVGPIFERVKTFPATNFYQQLNHAAVSGYAHNTMAVRTVRIINELVCLRNRHWTGRRPADLSERLVEEYQNQFTENLDLESRYRESLDSSAVTWKMYTVTVYPET